MINWFRRPAPWQGRLAADCQHALAVEATLAKVRVVIVLVSLATAFAEPGRPHWPAVTGVLLAMAFYSIGAAVALRTRHIRSRRAVVALHVCDTVGILTALFLTGGVLSPFSTIFLFVLLAAGYRWGQLETWLTCGAGILALGAHALMAQAADWGPPSDGHLVTLRLAYLGIGGLLIGYMAEIERVHRYRAGSVSRILGRIRAEAGLVAAVQGVLDELLAQFRADRAVLVLEEEGDERVALWEAERAADDSSHSRIRLKQEWRHDNATYLFPVPGDVGAFSVRRPAPEGSEDQMAVLALDAAGDRFERTFSVAPLLHTPFAWTTAFCLPAFTGEGWKGRLFLFMSLVPRAPRDQLGYLQAVVRQVGPAIFNLYLQRRLQSRAGVVERTRISRELHDGVIQALIGVEMQLEVMRREAAGKLPNSTAAQLEGVQRILGQEILNVRDLMQMLKPAEVDATRLVEHLADTVERFRYRTGIQARFDCNEDEIDLTPRVCRELARIVQEALANVRKHSGATSVVVSLHRQDGHWQLVIDDNGRGLDFEGHLTHEEAEAQRKGPLVIKEGVRAIGGRLALDSHTGFGARLEITIPRKHHA